MKEQNQEEVELNLNQTVPQCFDEINRAIQKCEVAFIKRYGDLPRTALITVWQDRDFQVEIRHGTKGFRLKKTYVCSDMSVDHVEI